MSLISQETTGTAMEFHRVVRRADTRPQAQPKDGAFGINPNTNLGQVVTVRP